MSSHNFYRLFIPYWVDILQERDNDIETELKAMKAEMLQNREYVPSTKRDAFQDLNAPFNLSLPLQWFMPDTERIASLHDISTKFTKERKKSANGTTYLSQFDLCFVWELSENTECCIPCCNYEAKSKGCTKKNIEERY